MELKIEKATVYDHGQIFDLLITWFDEITDTEIPGPCAYSGIWIAELIAKHVVLVAKVENKIVGSLGLRVTHFPWNNEVKVMNDDFLMTIKEYRHLKVADKLIQTAKKFAKDLGIILMMGHFSGIQAELKDKYLSRIHGLKYLGGNFIYKGE